MIAARRPVARIHQPVRRSMRRKHGDALHAQRATIDNVVVVALHGDQFAVANSRHHATAARAEIARSRKFVDFGEL